MPPRPVQLVCLISGGGRTVLNLLEAIVRGELHAQIPLVIADRDCPGVPRCRDRGLTAIIEPGPIAPARLEALLSHARADLVCLAGYLRLLPVPPAWRGRILNIHPALLPAFGGPGMYGHRVHASVLAAYARGEVAHSGCTVHHCDDRYDTGPIVLQRSCPILPHDTPDSLAARVFEQECLAYPEAIRRVAAELGIG
jgi:phosphoribosylglycinamide formyltransferase-1